MNGRVTIFKIDKQNNCAKISRRFQTVQCMMLMMITVVMGRATQMNIRARRSRHTTPLSTE